MKTIILFLTLATFLSGCAVGPRYRTPDTVIPEKYKELESSLLPESMADTPWWEIFNDQVLQDLIREALRNNYNLKTAAARVDEARALMGVSRAALLPQSDLVGGAQRDRNSKVLYPAAERLTSTYSGGFNTTWEIDLWGRIRQQVSSAKMEALAAEEFRRGVMITLVADTAQSYFMLRELDLELQIAKDTYATRKETYDLFVERQKGGVASDLEVSQAAADMHETEAKIPDLQRRIAIEENRICVLLGRNPGFVERGLVITDQIRIPEVPAAGLPSDLLKRRPDIVEAEYVVKSANALVGSATADFLPQLDLNHFIGGEGHRPSDLWGDKSFAWTIGGETQLPLFHGGRNVYHYQSVKAQWRQAVEQYKQTVISAFTDVANSLTDVKRFAEIRAAQELQVKSDRRAAELSKTRYEGGFSSYLEVLDAERRRFASENALAQTIGNQFIALSNLYRALGGGWQMDQVGK